MSQSNYQVGFLGDILGQEIPNLYDPYIQYYYYCKIKIAAASVSTAAMSEKAGPKHPMTLNNYYHTTA